MSLENPTWTEEEQLATIQHLQRLIDNRGVRAVESLCHLRDLLGMPLPPLEELQRIAKEVNEA